jgi:Cu(I)/Ag(I) efflux system membrane fusion protein
MNPAVRLTRRDFLRSALAAALLPAALRAAAPADYYTCTMHPSVHAAVPGNCPICGMELVAVHRPAPEAGGASDSAPAPFTVAPARQQMIGVTFATVRRAPLSKTLRAVGTVASELPRHWDCVSRVEGYVRDLAVASEGEQVAAGQTLLTLYSPELLASEREFVDALQARDDARAAGGEPAADADRLLAAARRRLELLEVDPREIAELERSRKPQDSIPYRAPVAATIEAILVHQGRRVSPGDHLVDLVDLSAVWVWARFYQEELSLVRSGMPLTVTSTACPGVVFHGRVGPTDPFLEEATRAGRTRIEVANPGAALRPGVYAEVELPVDFGVGLTVPFGAVLPTGSRNLVFLDRGQGRLEPRYIELGGKFGNDYAVTAGLQEGDRVVASANFLIDAEAKVQGAIKDF